MATIRTRSVTAVPLTANQYDENVKLYTNTQAGNYPVVVADNRSTIEYTGAGGHTVTMPDVVTTKASAQTGDFETTIKNGGAGTLTVAFFAGDTVDGVDADITLASNESITLKAGTSIDWIVTEKYLVVDSSVKTFLTTPTSANLLAAVTNETGTGSLVFATGPTLSAPILGTPASGNLSLCTALPISTGVSGLGTGVATFLGAPTTANLLAAVTGETGTGAVVFGTSPTIASPTFSGTVAGTYTLGGTPTLNLATLTTSGDLPVASGGTGASTAPAARTALGISYPIVGGTVTSGFAQATVAYYSSFSGQLTGQASNSAGTKSVCPVDGTLQNFYVRTADNSLSASLTVALLIDGVASGLTVTVTAGSTAVFSDVANTAAITAGQLLTVKATSASGTGTVNHASWGVSINQ